MRADVLVESGEFYERLKDDIRSARDHVYLQAMTFEADDAGLRISEELRSSPADDVRVLVDEYIRVMISDSCVYAPTTLFKRDVRQEAKDTLALFESLNEDGVRVKMVNPLGFMFTRLLARNHKKLVVIDGRIAYVGGINFSDHNFEWHDMMLRIEEEEIAGYLKEDFLSTWSGVDRKNRKSFDGVDFYQFDGRSNEKHYRSIFQLIEEAEDSIIIESPYISFPFYDRLRRAGRRGVDIRMILPEKNNKPVMQKYNLWEVSRSNIDLRLYRGNMTHLKAMLIDDKHLIVGSSNFDYVSYRSLQELVVVISDPGVIANFKESVFEPDWRASVPWDGSRCSRLGGFWYLFLKAQEAVWLGLERATARAGG